MNMLLQATWRCRPLHGDVAHDDEAVVGEMLRRLEKLLPDEPLATVPITNFEELSDICVNKVA